MRLSAIALLGGLLVSLPMWLLLCPPGYAAGRHQAFTAPRDQDLALAGVSVVRLIASYISPLASATALPVAECTGLGVIVNSVPTQGVPGTTNAWVLTAETVVGNNDDQVVPCDVGHTPGKLASIQIITSTAYNSQHRISFITTTTPIVCPRGTAATSCSSDLALVPFGDATTIVDSTTRVSSSALQAEPFVDRAAKASQGNAIALTQQAATSGNVLALPPAIFSNQLGADVLKQLTTFETPQKVATASKLEAGTPLVDSTGDLVGMSLGTTPGLSLDTVNSFLKVALPDESASHLSNQVHDSWKNGISNFYQQQFPLARQDFQQAAQANPNFQAASDFAALAANPPSQGSEHGGSASPSSGTTSSGEIKFLNYPIPFWLLGIVGLGVLVVLLLLTTLFMGRSRARQRALQAELAEADRRADLEAQRIKEQEAAQMRSWGPSNLVGAPSGPLPPIQQMSPSLHNPPQASKIWLCPNCKSPVSVDANYCPNCRMWLSPTESGLHLRVRPQASGATSAPPAPLAPPVSPVVALPDQPTLLPPSAVPVASSIADHPTVEIEPQIPDWQKNEEETTVPIARRFAGRHLGFVAGTNTNPGIKRQYKPNEDSLFAAQGLLDMPTQSQPFGLFVIADGMGGHANGQDASRLAIQRIIAYILPKLLGAEHPTTDEGYVRLLVDGIQSANQAVHHQNMEQRGDMGTTTTAALVVDSVAYVANVGDSRTYLYRPPQGLRKVTNDHSVVASLVEAGIIKPDDIYTHPKRNQIYRSLGEKPAVEIDSFTVPLQDGDKLLLCSDGLWDMVRDPKIEEVVKRADLDPNVTGEALIHAALEGGGEDNVSVIVVNMSEAARNNGMPRIQLLYKPDSVQMPQV